MTKPLPLIIDTQGTAPEINPLDFQAASPQAPGFNPDRSRFMIRNTLSAFQKMALALICLFAISLSVLMPYSALAQDQASEPETSDSEASDSETTDRPTFKLLRDDETAAADLAAADDVDAWIPALRKGTIDISLGVGFLNLDTTLLQHDQIIYKYTTETTSWGDVEFKGEKAFSPTMRIGYNFTGWLAIEGWMSMSVSKYESIITNRHSRKNEPNAPIVDDPPLGEFDAEKRSLITLQTGLNALIYPFDIVGDRSGRLHPYVTGGAGNMWYSMNSNYVKDMTSSVDLNAGLGLLFLADRNISLRLELLIRKNDIEWTPADYFAELNEGTTLVPLDEFPVSDDGSIDQKPVTKYESNAMSLIHFSIGVQGSF